MARKGATRSYLRCKSSKIEPISGLCKFVPQNPRVAINPAGKNYSDLAHRFLRDWRLSASWELN